MFILNNLQHSALRRWNRHTL